MKKLMVVVALLITVLCFSSMANAREVNYKVDYNFNRVFYPGEVVHTTVHVKYEEKGHWQEYTDFYRNEYVEFNSEINGADLLYSDPLYNTSDYIEYDLMFTVPETTGCYDIIIKSPYVSGTCRIKVKVLNKKAPTVKYTFKDKTLTLKWNTSVKKGHDGLSCEYHNYELQYKYNDGKWHNYPISSSWRKCVIANCDWLNGWEKGTYKFRVRDKHRYGNTNWSVVTIKIK